MLHNLGWEVNARFLVVRRARSVISRGLDASGSAGSSVEQLEQKQNVKDSISALIASLDSASELAVM